MRSLLIRCYPARWRARYGEEFALVLGDRPLGPFDVADVLLGALDAHLHLRGLGAASIHGKGFAMTLRIGGYAAILGGLLWFIALAGNAINDGAETGAGWILIALLAAIVATLVALIGLSAFQARRHPVLVWAAFAVPAVGAVVSLFGALAMAASGDSARAIIGGLSGWAISTLGVTGLVIGSGLFALATLRARVLSRGAAALLGVGSIVVVLGLAGVTGGLLPSGLEGGVIVAMVLMFPAGWAGLGVSALRTERAGMPHFEGAIP
ncbi:MAG: hypothetical protein HW391_1226 [Chloroflexi bacterium]|nr:hypothetical protein [Chloroflexota bacterium]